MAELRVTDVPAPTEENRLRAWTKCILHMAKDCEDTQRSFARLCVAAMEEMDEGPERDAVLMDYRAGWEAYAFAHSMVRSMMDKPPKPENYPK